MDPHVTTLADPISPAHGYKVPSNGGERLPFQGMEFVIRASAESTGGAFSIIEEVAPVDAPMHIHHNADEWFYVLEGNHIFTVGGTEIPAGPGDLIFGPKGVPHAQRRVVPRTGRILTMFSPAGMEQFFRDVSEADRAGSLGPEDMVRIAGEHGAVWVD